MSSRLSGAMAPTGQALTQAPQSTHAAGSMYNISDVANPGSSGEGWMQLTGHAKTQDPSLQHDCVMTCGINDYAAGTVRCWRCGSLR
ncbi:hypothetical protein MKUB_43420 [Mycobacterium kubicae]|uniref:Uncharacterized protein n=1 Tax=Mycobacterium kubicae TaxID=120959 RepID=A0ABQ1BSZ2_9MYCO|nr:hypothetical protein MKUB_43420 [Mycobacterium kubicae]